MFLFSQHRSSIPTGRNPFGSSLLVNGVLCMLFGLAILAAPELLAYIVASFMIIVGASLIISWWRIRR
jgi:uncharacterized membrane protein HdeD (DUF308 family)